MSYHNVEVEYENGDIRSWQVKDVNHWESGVCELVFPDGSTKVIKKFVEFSMSPPLDDETNEPLDTIRETSNAYERAGHVPPVNPAGS